MLQRWSKRLTETLRLGLRRGTLFLLGGLLSVLFAVTPMMSQPAHAQLAGLQSLGGSFTNGLSSCAIETVGWVICPTMRSIAKLADYGFTYINKSFLRIDYSFGADDSGIYKAWEIMRTIANASFVVAFMVLVYSQISGKGAGGYNIKRLLPRLVIAAIAVNVSYFLCVILIDITNILGDSILFILNDQIAARVGQRIFPVDTPAFAFWDGTLTIITSSIMTKPGFVWVLLAPVAAVVVSVATICAATIVLLIMRKVVISMLVLMSPLLFVAYLLPNLERFFTQAARLFIQLLMLYPIIAFLLGTGQIVSATIVSVGSVDANYRQYFDFYFSIHGGSGSAITDLVACGAAVLPLLGVWFIFKNMSSIMSSAGTRLSASVRGRRGSGEKSEARVTGKANSGNTALKNPGLGNGPNRRQAYSRNKHRRSLGDSSLTGDRERIPPNRTPQSPNQGLQNAFGGGQSQSEQERPKSDEENAKKLEELQNARIDGAAEGVDIDEAALAAAAGAGANNQNQDDKKGKKPLTAKELFSQLNRKQDHESKDKERKFSSGPGAAGGGGGGGGGGASAGSVQPSAPTASYRAPGMAQGGNIVSGSSGPQQPMQVVAVPVQVDGSSLLGNNANHPPENISQPPISGTEEKAKSRAQKYLFDTEKDLEDARDSQDILKQSDDSDGEPPHLSQQKDRDKDED